MDWTHAYSRDTRHGKSAKDQYIPAFVLTLFHSAQGFVDKVCYGELFCPVEEIAAIEALALYFDSAENIASLAFWSDP
jgi:hypothetical protein